MSARLQSLRSIPKERPALLAGAVCGSVSLLCAIYLLRNTPPWELERLWQRLADLKPAKVDDYIAFGLWIGAAAAGLIGLVLALSARLWARPRNPELTVEVAADGGRPVRRFWLMLGLVVIVAGALRAPRMDHSFWGDEGWAYTDLIGGRFTGHEDGSLDFTRHPWKMTLFWDKGLNNQYLFTVTARICLDAWQSASGAEPYEFSEVALRFPSFVAGLLSIAAAALLLRRLGYPSAGIALAVLLAIHPWHLRYSAEARGYTMLILFLILALHALVNALASDRRRWWLAFALAQFAALYTWKAAIHPMAAINLSALAILVVRLRRRALVPASRCVAAGGLSLMAFVPLFAPAILQISLNLKKSTAMQGSMGADWWRNVWSQLLGAMDWANSETGTPFDTLTRLAEHAPPAVWGFALFLVPLLAAAGLALALRTRWTGALLIAAPLVGGLLAFAHFSLNGTHLLKWYLFFCLPFLLAFLAIALTSLRLQNIAARLAPTAVFVAVYLAIFGHHLTTLITTPIQNPREADALTRADHDGLSLAPSERLSVGLFRRVVCYDPRMLKRFDSGSGEEPIRSAEVLKAVMRHADATGRPLRVTAANLPFARATHPDFFELIEDERFFTKLATFPAIEAYITIEVYEYRSGSVTSEEGQGEPEV